MNRALQGKRRKGKANAQETGVGQARLTLVVKYDNMNGSEDSDVADRE